MTLTRSVQTVTNPYTALDFSQDCHIVEQMYTTEALLYVKCLRLHFSRY